MPDNNLDSNTTSKVLRAFNKGFEMDRVLTKTINTSTFKGQFTPQFGDTVAVKRPHQAVSKRTPTGDITGMDKNKIISGKANGVVQDYITVDLDWENLEEAIQLDQLDEILMPYGAECANALETSLGNFMVENAGLTYGTPGTAITKWTDVAGANALMDSIGVPTTGEHYYITNPFNVTNLASAQSGLTSADGLVRTAWQNAQIATPFAGLRALSSNSLTTYQAGADTARSGTLLAAPVQTYLSAKDSMIQTLSLTGLDTGITDAILPGETIVITTALRTHINIRSRTVAFDDSGAQIQWKFRVVTGGDTDGSGNVSVQVTNSAINEAVGQYNNIFTELEAGDGFTILGTEDVIYQPSLFYHKDAFSLETVNLPRLAATEGSSVTRDGFNIRFTKYSDGDANVQKARFDLLPVFAVLNPLFAGHGFGVP